MAIPTNPIDKLIARVKLNLGRGTGNTTINEYCIEWYNRAQKDICKRENFYFMYTSTELSFVAGDDEESLPTYFKGADSVWIKDSNGKFTELLPMDDMDYRRFYSDDTSVGVRGQPAHYIVGASTLKVRPYPDQSYTVVLVYWAYLANLLESNSNTNELLNNYDELLEARTTYWGFRSLQQWTSAKEWNDIYMEKLHDLVVENADRILPDELILHARPDVKASTLDAFAGRQ